MFGTSSKTHEYLKGFDLENVTKLSGLPFSLSTSDRKRRVPLESFTENSARADGTGILFFGVTTKFANGWLQGLRNLNAHPFMARLQ